MPKVKTAPDPLKPVEPIPVPEVAKALGVRLSAVYELCRTRKLRHLRAGGKIVITADDVAEFKRKNTVVPVA